MKNIQAKSKRNSNIELVRIIAMIMIVCSHYISHGSLFQATDMPFGVNKIFLDSMVLGNLGVAMFITITGYFMVTSTFKSNRIINIVMQVWFYSMGIFVIFCMINHSVFSVGNIIKSVFPIITSNYWFVTAYIVLCCFMPFINKLLVTINRKEHLFLIFVLFTIWFLLPTFFMFDVSVYGGRVAQFITFYSIGAYIRLYPNNFLLKKKVSILLTVFASSAMLFSVVIFDYLAQSYVVFTNKSEYFYATFSAIQLVLAVAIVALALGLKPKYNNFINVIGGCTFGVYLIHDNRLVRNWIWGDVFNNATLVLSNKLILHAVLSIVIVYSVCTLIEAIRKFVLEKYLFKRIYIFVYDLTDRILNFIGRCIAKFIIE